jgi:hypothetical protein
MSDFDQLGGSISRRLWEALFSLHVGLAATSVTFVLSVALEALFSRMETSIKFFLHVRQTDLVRGDLAVWIPSVSVALLAWLMLRATAHTRFTQRVLRSIAGIVTIFIPLPFWVILYQTTSWPLYWRCVGFPLEMTAALVFALRFSSGKWTAPSWAGLLLLGAHYVFWYFAPDSSPSISGYAGPLGPMLGFCSAVAWGAHVSRLRKVETVVPLA